jgi:hypothetical protein
MYNFHPVHAVNQYLWARIEQEGILSKSNYKNLVPIVPVKEAVDLIIAIDSQPGVTSYPYIVYTWNRLSTGSIWFMKTHQIAYAIRSSDDDKMRQLINLFEQEFQDQDRAAMRLNAYLSTLPSNSPLKGYQFKYLSLATLGGQLPTDSQAGVEESLITISATFVGQDVYYGQ